MIPLGTFGNEYFGHGYFGVVQAGIPLAGNVVSPLIFNALNQEIENVQQVGGTVTLAGVDVSELVESITIKIDDKNITSTATVVFVGSAPAGLVADAALVVGSIFRFEDGTTFTNTLFSGVVRSIQESDGGINKSTKVEAHDTADSLLSVHPTATTYSGSAKALVEYELATAGIANYSVDFADYTMTDADLTAFETVRELILAVANAKDSVSAWFRSSDGLLIVQSDFTVSAASWSIGQKGYTSIQGDSNDTDKHKTLTVQGTTGLTATAIGTGTQDGTETSRFFSAVEDLQARADAAIAIAERATWTIQTGLNPLVKIGQTANIANETGTSFSGRVSGITHSIQWPAGAWSTITFQAATPSTEVGTVDPGGYRYFRLVVTECVGGGASGSMVIPELQLFDASGSLVTFTANTSTVVESDYHNESRAWKMFDGITDFTGWWEAYSYLSGLPFPITAKFDAGAKKILSKIRLYCALVYFYSAVKSFRLEGSNAASLAAAFAGEEEILLTCTNIAYTGDYCEVPLA